MARIKTTISKNSKSYSIIEDYNRNGKRTTRIINKIGNEAFVCEQAKKENMDTHTWLKNYLNQFLKDNFLDNSDEKIIIEKFVHRLIPKDVVNKFNVGYLFLEDIYYSLKLDKIVKEVSKKYKFEFDLNEVLSYLVYSRIIYPSSKLKTYELSQNFIEIPKYNLIDLYKGLTYLNKELNYIQKQLYNNSKSIIDRNTRILYYDCTNYYFDISEEDDLRKYTGNAKDKKSKPVVGMGLFMDGYGLPISMGIFSGNKNESTTLIPLEKMMFGINEETGEIFDSFEFENCKTIICTDAAMCTDEIKYFNVQEGRAFVITQSIKKLKKEYQQEVLDDNNWRILGDLTNIYKLSDIINDEEKRNENYETIFYKIIQTETNHVVQDLIVTYQIKYHDYLKRVRESQIERARKKIKNNDNGEKIKLSTNQNDYRRFIKEEVTLLDETKEVSDQNSLNQKKKEKYTYSYSINEEVISEEEKYDGYYGVTTNLNGDIEEILKITKNRWEIEESFRILKTDFDSGTIHLSREDRITAHFLTCFISLLIYRILENKLDYKYTNTQIIQKLRDMEVLEEKGAGYLPAYTRDDLTDDLHTIFGFRTDFEITTYENFKKIFKQVRK